MILAQHLRIGNKFHGIAGVQTVFSIEDNTSRGTCEYRDEKHKLMYSHLILCEENGNQYKPCEIDGILLTNQLLKSYGFIDRDYFRIITSHIKIRLGTEAGESSALWFWTGNEWACICRLKYLHELQNKFFSLTDTELLLEKTP